MGPEILHFHHLPKQQAQDWGLANFFCEGPYSNYFRLRESVSLCCNYSKLPEKFQKQTQGDLAPGVEFADCPTLGCKLSQGMIYFIDLIFIAQHRARLRADRYSINVVCDWANSQSRTLKLIFIEYLLCSRNCPKYLMNVIFLHSHNNLKQ